MDDPERIVNGALENHYKMIKQMKGVPFIGGFHHASHVSARNEQ